ncbi:MAG TPA: hypothetical protein VMP12_00850 [Candidatus Sulfotelmatobacter sp.]|nr:hypothetical protein [Candidatus Sulfotelmatobacter sp.]
MYEFASMVLVVTAAFSIAQPQNQNARMRLSHRRTEFSGENEDLIALPIHLMTLFKRSEASTTALLNTRPLNGHWLREFTWLDLRQRDLIKMGIGGLRGAHVVPFWVFRKKQESYELVLATGGDALSVISTRWRVSATSIRIGSDRRNYRCDVQIRPTAL